MVTLAHVWAKLHYKVCKLIQIWAHFEINNSFLLEERNLLRSESMHLYHSQLVLFKYKWKSEFLQLMELSLQWHKFFEISLALMTLFQSAVVLVVIHLVNVQITVRTLHHFAVALCPQVGCQAWWHLRYFHPAETALVGILSYFWAAAEMLLPELILEDLTAHIRAIKLWCIEETHDLAGNLAWLEWLFAERTVVWFHCPCLVTCLAEKPLTFRTTDNIVNYIHANGAKKLLDNFTVFG